jgi:hypothetical protein
VSDRTRLPGRRLTTTHKVEWRGDTFLISVGWATAGEGAAVPAEFFIAAPTKAGSDLVAIVEDGCVLGSLLLQHGVPPERLWRAVGRAGHQPHDDAASLLGLAVRTVAEAAERGLYATLPEDHRS